MKLIQYKETSQYIDGLAQECGISSANALMIQVQSHWYINSKHEWTHCSPVMPYGDIELNEYWPR